jgi:hypothetical protein
MQFELFVMQIVVSSLRNPDPMHGVKRELHPCALRYCEFKYNVLFLCRKDCGVCT